jgi:hypothetical protein
MNTHAILLNLNDLEIKLLRDATANLGTDCVNDVTLQLKIAHAILDSSYSLPSIQQEPFVDFSGLGIAKSSSVKINDRVEIKTGEGHVVKVINTRDGDMIKVVLDQAIEVRCYNGDVAHLQEFWVTSFDVKRI